jgi:hypothetical protein
MSEDDIEDGDVLYQRLETLSEQFWTNRAAQRSLSRRIKRAHEAGESPRESDVVALEHLRTWAATHQREADTIYATWLATQPSDYERVALGIDDSGEYRSWADRVEHGLRVAEITAEIKRANKAFLDEEIVDDPDSGLAGIG